MGDAPSSPAGPGGPSSSQATLSGNEEILLRSAIRRILESADLSSVSAKKVREELISLQSQQSSNGGSSSTGPIVPPSLDILSHKKQINALVKVCFEEVSAQKEQETAAAAALAAVSAGGHQSRATASPSSRWNGSAAAAPRSTFAAGGIALPGIGAAPPSAPPPTTTAASRKKKPASSASSSSVAVKKRKREEDGIEATASAIPPSFASSPAASSVPSGYGDEDIEAELAELEDDTVPRGRAAKRSKAAANKAGAKVKREPNPNNPFNRPMVLSASMAEICGQDELSRPQVVKQLWAYIKGNNLQNPTNKRQILCDEKLQTLFGKNMVDSFEMAKLIGKHIKKKEDIL
ncbi:unnamed protein product [Tilletia controversa]|uniref:DM2 domain-containing protein n=1 Tax=Tilletia controversa TaxID=13291 RepID=A0A8X7MXJ1_9BASI|nr:hypothetical protein CF328_g7017 [Tilletia controversa]CAD6886865.1 unnamed protein product [Tilletia caries]KAE8252125.1 hypothetical protein A4X06_0g2408 [Tilletia controversa]CAD6898082.1 unnamed protein product [Tilletia controversa]CAD6908118.1 unnamed protein product [Tilletia controversa]